MCQAYEEERYFLLSKDKRTRLRGWEACKAGVSRDSCPERDHPNPEYSDARQWKIGWDTADSGKDPW